MCSASGHSLPWAVDRTEHDESGSRHSFPVGTVAKVATRSTWSSGTAPRLSRSTTSSRRQGARSTCMPCPVRRRCERGPSPRAVPTSRSKSASVLRVTTTFLILTGSELRSALDRPRELPKYLIKGIPTLEAPLATDPAQRETVFLFRYPHWPHWELTISTCPGADRQRCVLDARDQVCSGQGEVVLNTVRGSTLQGADDSTALDKNTSVRCPH